MELELPQDFKELLKSFNENKVKYLLIGGYAVGIHGHVRATNDLDLAISDFGFAGETVTTELFTQKNSVVRMGVAPVKIEILNYLHGPGFDAAYERKKTVKIEDIEVDVISLDDLYENKLIVGRHQDLADVENLRKKN
jgi:predicted nucleotidyltransferase